MILWLVMVVACTADIVDFLGHKFSHQTVLDGMRQLSDKLDKHEFVIAELKLQNVRLQNIVKWQNSEIRNLKYTLKKQSKEFEHLENL